MLTPIEEACYDKFKAALHKLTLDALGDGTPYALVVAFCVRQALVTATAVEGDSKGIASVRKCVDILSAALLKNSCI